MKVTIPANSTALVYIPFVSGAAIKEGGKDISTVKEIEVIAEENGRKVVRIGSGVYEFEVEQR